MPLLICFSRSGIALSSALASKAERGPRPCTSAIPCGPRVHLVAKKDGSFRPCGDFRRLNAATEPDRYPIPFLTDATRFLHGKRIFSKIDLVKSYHQIPVAAADRHKTAVITPFGLFEFLRVPFGLRNAAQAFQRMMDQVAGDLDFIFIYLDDILVASASEEEHLRHLEMLFNRLEEHGLVVNVDKCVLGVPSLEFLGHQKLRTHLLLGRSHGHRRQR